MSIDSVPGEVIDTVIQQAEDLNIPNSTTKSVSDYSKYTSNQLAKDLLFDLTIDSVAEEPSNQNYEELLLYLTIDNVSK